MMNNNFWQKRFIFKNTFPLIALKGFLVGVIFVMYLPLSEAVANEIEKAEAWFNNLSSYKADFKQVSSDGSVATGKFFMRRPYRMRFEYADPIPLTLITSKNWLHVDEEDQKTVTSYPISETPLSLLLQEKVVLTSPEITTKTAESDGVISIALTKEGGEAAGRITLEFLAEPFELRRWVITDANGIVTNVYLSNAKKGVTILPELFVPTDYPNNANNN